MHSNIQAQHTRQGYHAKSQKPNMLHAPPYIISFLNIKYKHLSLKCPFSCNTKNNVMPLVKTQVRSGLQHCAKTLEVTIMPYLPLSGVCPVEPTLGTDHNPKDYKISSQNHKSGWNFQAVKYFSIGWWNTRCSFFVFLWRSYILVSSLEGANSIVLEPC